MKKLVCILIVSCWWIPSALGDDDTQFFEAKVRPLLVEHCYECHGKEAKKVRGELLLDTREGWMKGGESGAVIVPGQPEKSPLIKALHYQGAIQMPPKGKLGQKEIATLTEWVKRGAPDPRSGKAAAPAARKIDFEKAKSYWAWQPLKNPTVPALNQTGWAKNPIDHFLLAAMAGKGIQPNPPADKRKLIRRAYLDLTGLPPSPQEVDDFVRDNSSVAFARVIDRLLQSRHYGERWGRHWLDVARFAESHGYEQDYDRPNAYHYRDFVIQALNQDLPYDTFVKWQLAGDELAPDNPMALMATGFLAAGTHATQITANQAEKERYDELDDMARTVGTTLLGMTLGCARCHDHKFDPFTSNDYYRLIATFSTTVRSDQDIPLDRAGYQKELATFQERLQGVEAKRAEWEKDHLEQRFSQWVKAGAKEALTAEYMIPEVVSAKSKNGASLMQGENGLITASGANADSDTYTLQLRSRDKRVAFLRLEALADGSLVKGGPGRAPNGNFALSNLQATVTPLDPSGKPATADKPVKFKTARATFEQKGLPVSAILDANMKSAWAIDPQFGKDHAAVCELEQPVETPHGALWSITLEFNNNKQHNLGKFRVSLSGSREWPALAGLSLPGKTKDIMERLSNGAPVNDQERGQAAEWYKTRNEEWKKLNSAVDEVKKSAPKPKLVKALISSEGVPAVRLHTQGADFYDPVHVLKRGDLNQKVAVAPQGFPVALVKSKEGDKSWLTSPPKDSPLSYRRTSLAKWITDTDQGAGMLLARVMVNRVWYLHFGRGIVATPSDFGVQGEKPSHPELLDWLAWRFVQSGWKLHDLHRLIMNSAAYQQSSQADENRLQKDRDNALVWHFQARRLEGEVIRDAMLGVSGLLDPAQFGPGLLDTNHKRRSIYFFIKRSKLVPMMMLFDGPDTLQDLPGRASTTIAPQALMLLNSPVVRGYADAFAARISQGAPGEEEQVRRAYEMALSRPVREEEKLAALAFLRSQKAQYRAENKKEDLALGDFCQALFSLNEFVFLD